MAHGPVPTGQNRAVHIPAKVDYGMRALLALTARGEPTTAEALAEAQALPSKFLGAILNDLRRAGIVASQRGSEGGYRLARPAAQISVADVMRALDGPLAEVRGLRPEAATYDGPGRAPPGRLDRRAGQPAFGARTGQPRRRGPGPAAPVGGQVDRGSRRLGPAPGPLTTTPSFARGCRSIQPSLERATGPGTTWNRA